MICTPKIGVHIFLKFAVAFVCVICYNVIMENVGEKIYNLRKEKGVSQEELAEAVNVARPTISRWENNTVIPTTENIQKLCAFFSVEINLFLSEEEIAAVNADKEIQPAAKDVKPQKFQTLKIVAIVAGMALLVLCIIACGIAVYVTAMPEIGGVWGTSTHSVSYASIIFIVCGVLATAIFGTLLIIFIKRYIKNKKNK